MIESLLLASSSKCRTIDKVDIFGDSSGVALYQLDGNANDTGGNYHGTETAITYGGGVYERGAVFNGTTSRAVAPFNIGTAIVSISLWAKGATNGATNQRIIDSSSGNFAGMCSMILNTAGQLAIGRGNNSSTEQFVSGAIGIGNNVWHHLVVVLNGNSVKTYVDNVLDLNTSTSVGLANDANFYIGTSSDLANGLTGSIDQVRIFNKELTATEVATLYAECAPTSIVDNINPFMDGSLKALYKFNGDATDATGVYNGTATNVTYGTGKFGQCAVFNGTSSSVDLGTSSSFTDLQTFSISAWVKTSDTTRYPVILSPYTAGTYPRGYIFRLNLGKISFSGYDNTATGHHITGTSTVGNNTWKHCVVTFSGGYSKLYVDGVLEATNNTAYTIVYYNPADSRRIGAINGDSTSYMNGSLDQVQFFNKVLTPMEVASLYNETTPLEEPMYKLVDPFKDGSGKALYRLEGNALDESGNYNGTATSVTYGAGQFGRCGVFNGSTSKIDTTIASTSLTTFSLSLWFKASASTAGTVYQKSKTGLTYAFGGTAGVLQFEYFTSNWFSFNISNSCVLGTWYNVVITYDGSVIRAYLNASLANSVTVTHDTTTVNMFLGSYQGTSSYFNGSIDHVRIFSRALTAGEVSTLYTSENSVI